MGTYNQSGEFVPEEGMYNLSGMDYDSGHNTDIPHCTRLLNIFYYYYPEESTISVHLIIIPDFVGSYGWAQHYSILEGQVEMSYESERFELPRINMEPILNKHEAASLIENLCITKTNTYVYNPTQNYHPATKKYVDDSVSTAISGLDITDREIVQQLPTQNISTSTIYMVPSSSPGSQNTYTEYMYINNTWEKIGDTEIDLSNYVVSSFENSEITHSDGSIYIGAQNENANQNLDYWLSPSMAQITVGGETQAGDSIDGSFTLEPGAAQFMISGPGNGFFVGYTDLETDVTTDLTLDSTIAQMRCLYDQDKELSMTMDSETGTITFVAPNGVKVPTPVANDDVATKGYVDSMTIQYNIMPEPSSSNEGQIIQYTGETNEYYTHGYFYQVIEQSNSGIPTYVWEQIYVQENPDLSNYVTEEMLQTVNLNNIQWNYPSYYLDGISFNTTENPWINPNLDDVQAAIIAKIQEAYNDENNSFYLIFRNNNKTHPIRNFPVLIEIDDSNNTITLTPYKQVGSITSAGAVSYSVSLSYGTWSINNGIISHSGEHIGAYLITNSTFNYLAKDNRTYYTPVENYNPATKLYVDNTAINTVYELSGLSEYSNSATYLTDEYVYRQGLIYKCNTDITVAESWDASHWTLVSYIEYMADKLNV